MLTSFSSRALAPLSRSRLTMSWNPPEAARWRVVFPETYKQTPHFKLIQSIIPQTFSRIFVTMSTEHQLNHLKLRLAPKCSHMFRKHVVFSFCSISVAHLSSCNRSIVFSVFVFENFFEPLS